MTKRRVRKYKGMKNYFQRTWKNKLVAIILIVIGLPIFEIKNDIAFTVFSVLFGIMMFCARDDMFKL